MKKRLGIAILMLCVIIVAVQSEGMKVSEGVRGVKWGSLPDEAITILGDGYAERANLKSGETILNYKNQLLLFGTPLGAVRGELTFWFSPSAGLESVSLIFPDMKFYDLVKDSMTKALGTPRETTEYYMVWEDDGVEHRLTQSFGSFIVNYARK